MKLEKFIRPELFLPHLSVGSKLDLLKVMTEAMAKSSAAKSSAISAEEILAAVLQREDQQSTGMGSGFAFPHARLNNINSVGVVIAVPDKPLNDYQSLDGKPIEFACMVIVPESRPGETLQIMAQVAGIFADSDFRKKIRNFDTAEKFLTELKERNLLKSRIVVASDFMRKPFMTLSEDESLRSATLQMSNKRLNSVPVVKEDMTLCGVITSSNLFKLGIPDFFSQLKSVAFINEFDPFEKYFFQEAHSQVKDVMSEDYCALPVNATLMELVFSLAIRNYSKAFIVDEDNKLLGVIDKTQVLERIINF